MPGQTMTAANHHETKLRYGVNLDKEPGLFVTLFRILIWLALLAFTQIVLANQRFLVISDIHFGITNPAEDGRDTGPKFLELSLNKFKELNKQVDFILNLGDLPTHHAPISKKAPYERFLFQKLLDANQFSKPMFYITGNNDALSGNYQPFEVNGKSPLNEARNWTGACVHCKNLLIDDSRMRQQGYYSSYVIPENKEIILIALNSIQWTKTPWYAKDYPNQEHDAQGQLSWFEQQLKNNHAKQLLIAMHVPPGKAFNGVDLWHKTYLQAFILLLEKYKDAYGQISLLTGHTHMDEFRNIQLSDGRSIFAYSTPAISRIVHNNPGMKVFVFDKQWRIKDFITYYTSSLSTWSNELYHALGNAQAIFPDCKRLTLAQCLSVVSDEYVCQHLEQGFFYGVKSSRVRHQGCRFVYRVRI